MGNHYDDDTDYTTDYGKALLAREMKNEELVNEYKKIYEELEDISLKHFKDISFGDFLFLQKMINARLSSGSEDSKPTEEIIEKLKKIQDSVMVNKNLAKGHLQKPSGQNS